MHDSDGVALNAYDEAASMSCWSRQARTPAAVSAAATMKAWHSISSPSFKASAVRNGQVLERAGSGIVVKCAS